MTEHPSLRNLIADNPSVILLLGLCPVLSATADVRSALAMGCITVLALICSCLIMNVLRKFLPKQFEFPAIFLVCAGVVSIIDLFDHALFPSVYQMLGLYVAALSVSLLLYASAADSCRMTAEKTLGQCLVLSLLLFVIMLFTAVIREVLGNASFAGVEIPALKDFKIAVLSQPAGAFFISAFLAAALNAAVSNSSGSEGVAAWLKELICPIEKAEESVK